MSALPWREDILCHVATILNMLIPCLDRSIIILAVLYTSDLLFSIFKESQGTDLR